MAAGLSGSVKRSGFSLHFFPICKKTAPTLDTSSVIRHNVITPGDTMPTTKEITMTNANTNTAADVTTTTYSIYNRATGVVLGEFEAESALDALRMLADDAGADLDQLWGDDDIEIDEV